MNRALVPAKRATVTPYTHTCLRGGTAFIASLLSRAGCCSMPRASQTVPGLQPGQQHQPGAGLLGAAGAPNVQPGRSGEQYGSSALPSAGKGKSSLSTLLILLPCPSKPKSCFITEGSMNNVQSEEKLFFTLIALELAE